VPAEAFEADADGDTNADADGDTGDDNTGDGDAGDDDTAITPDESAALRPWMDPLPHPTTMIPMAAAHAATRRVAFT
jgi:hypothetical protein